MSYFIIKLEKKSVFVDGVCTISSIGEAIILEIVRMTCDEEIVV